MKSMAYSRRRCHDRWTSLFYIFIIWWGGRECGRFCVDDALLLSSGPKASGPTLEQPRKVVPLRGKIWGAPSPKLGQVICLVGAFCIILMTLKAFTSKGSLEDGAGHRFHGDFLFS